MVLLKELQFFWLKECNYFHFLYNDIIYLKKGWEIMTNKPRVIPYELTILKHLTTRMNLPAKDKQYYSQLGKGFEGENKFDEWTEKLQCDCIILNDLLLKVNNTTFQIDSLLITEGKIYFYEVKNYEGDYLYDEQTDNFFKMPQHEIINPLLQVARSESLLNQLLLKLGFNIPVEGAVVFIHDEFTLYQAPPEKPIIYPNQLKRYFTKLNNLSSRLSRRHYFLADKLSSLHITDSPYKQIPAYSYDQLRKGITCKKCGSFSVYMNTSKCICKACGFEEKVTDSLMRSVREFQILFPEKRITTKDIKDWCQVIESMKIIRKILERNFKVVGDNRWTYYTDLDR